ncbi:targeting protein for Xklp2-like [Scyliorhinus canicula]|uniref:targeting protein for Xklp2-like n=1 Tax=Scyliorhinus canicula TaxID=7830 RepID=UPI0018F31729|nr:targeting protein for Xklp2-like [Scyliorhinus canicula]
MGTIRVTLPSFPGKQGVPKAVVFPMTHFEAINISESGHTSAETHNSSSTGLDRPTIQVAWTDNTDSPAQHSPAQQPPFRVNSEHILRAEYLNTVPQDLWRASPTVPRTPMVLRRRQRSQRPMSTEELEMETISRLQKETAEHIKRNQEIMHRAIAGTVSDLSPGQHTRRNSNPLTFPVNTQLHTTLSATAHTESKSDTEYKEFNFIQELRKYTPLTRVFRRCTVPKPFMLEVKRKNMNIKPYISMAEFISKFEYRSCGAAAKGQETPEL